MTLLESHIQCCRWKVKYSDEQTAMAAFVASYPRTLLTKNRRKTAKSLTLYICTCCGYLHLSQHGTKLI